MRKEPLSRPTFRETFIGRYINEIRVLGLEKRFNPEKNYNFIISTRWSDGSEKIVYRTLSQLKHILSTIQQILPIQTASRISKDLNNIKDCNSSRMNSHLKCCAFVTSLFTTILESESTFINFALMKYLKSSPSDFERLQINTSAVLICHHRSLTQDLRQQMNELKSSNVIIDKYLVQEDFNSEHEGDLNVEAGDYVIVLKKNVCGWWFAENHDGDSGWIAANFLEAKSVDKKNQALIAGEMSDTFIAIKSYEKQAPDELTFPKDASLELVSNSYDGWPLFEYKSEIGRAPIIILQKIPVQHE